MNKKLHQDATKKLPHAITPQSLTMHMKHDVWSSCRHKFINCMEINASAYIFTRSTLYSSSLFTHCSFWCSCLFKSNLQFYTVHKCKAKQRRVNVECNGWKCVEPDEVPLISGINWKSRQTNIKRCNAIKFATFIQFIHNVVSNVLRNIRHCVFAFRTRV